MKVLLVEPPFNPKSLGSALLSIGGFPEPIALEILAASIPDDDVKILDMRIENTLDQTISEFQPHVIGTGGLTNSISQSKAILKRAKGLDPNITTIIGGHHATVQPYDFFEPYIDIIVSGEGEITFPELLKALKTKDQINEVKGLYIYNKDGLKPTGKRELIDLSAIPFPRRDLTKHYRNRYFRGQWRSYATVISSRGCPYRCHFCAMWKIYNGRYRVRNSRLVMDEIESLSETFIDFIDDNTIENIQRMEKMISIIRERQLKKEYKIYARSDTIADHPYIFEEWGKLGLRLVLLGLESFREEELKAMNKANTIKKNEEALSILERNGIEALSYIMVKSDYSDEDFEALSEYVQRKNVKQPVFSVYTPFPGTELFDENADYVSSKNWELYDGMHALLPTKLPLHRFYHNFAQLYRNAYLKEIPPHSPLEQKEALQRLSAYLESIYQRMENAYMDHSEDGKTN